MTKEHIPLNERIIFALDVPSANEAKEWVERLESHVRFYKVGLQLFLAGGFPMVEWLTRRGHKVMLDLKFFDVPATVERAVQQVNDHGVAFTTVHGNDAIIEAAVASRKDVKILGVTVLTSFAEDDLRQLGLTGTIEELVYYRAKKALELGCDGLVSSGLEAQRMRAHLGNNFLIVTPGIRPGINREVEADDQKRIATAKLAIQDGADYVVVGRPIKQAADPLAVVGDLQDEISIALVARDNQ
ncbi:MAG: orotidine-5'-phosphate decarboxylase [Deltaproteobacteria bacterium]|nr:orotidine-5'-phosphate decarboxylase [Candidatus Anaeroferrophillus wilburensis]MBN2888991.1 orotidine-5'-phosphate decarboxylase [Deltaproteobacteria bacterium]